MESHPSAPGLHFGPDWAREGLGLWLSRSGSLLPTPPPSALDAPGARRRWFGPVLLTWLGRQSRTGRSVPSFLRMLGVFSPYEWVVA